MSPRVRLNINTLLILTYISLALSLTITQMLFGTGALSIATVGTAVYHIVILVVLWRRRRKNVEGVVNNALDRMFSAGTTNGALVWAFLLAQFWVLSELSLLQVASTSVITTVPKMDGSGGDFDIDLDL